MEGRTVTTQREPRTSLVVIPFLTVRRAGWRWSNRGKNNELPKLEISATHPQVGLVKSINAND